MRFIIFLTYLKSQLEVLERPFPDKNVKENNLERDKTKETQVLQWYNHPNTQRTTSTWLDSKYNGSSDFSPRSRPLCFADTMKDREGRGGENRVIAIGPPQVRVLQNCLSLFRTKTAGCVDIYVGYIWAHDGWMDMEGPLSLSCSADWCYVNISALCWNEKRDSEELLFFSHFFSVLVTPGSTSACSSAVLRWLR